MTHISLDQIHQFQQIFTKSSRNRLAQNATSRTDLRQVAMNWDHFARVNHTFSCQVTDELPITNQNKSGRCWLFAALNLLRINFARKHKLQEFEFSQSYLFFWDKLEKANYFLENIIETVKEPHDGRLVMHLMEAPLGDGGQWHMFVNLVEKYGLVPQSVYPDCEASLNSLDFNRMATLHLRECASKLRDMMQKGMKKKEVQDHKTKMLEEFYRILSIHFGTPPAHFDWEYVTKEKKFQAERGLTPLSFFKKHVKQDLNDYVCLVHSPRKSTPIGKTYTIRYLGNVIEGTPIRYLNVEIDEMKKATMATLKDNQPVWFGCDVGKCFHRDIGLMDLHLYNYELLYDVPFKMKKEARMNYGESKMTHAMLFTGVNIVDQKPTRWRVENSWGDKVGKKGFFIMTDEWFSEYMFEVAIEKKYLPKKLIELSQKEPTPLDPWDPLGALA